MWNLQKADLLREAVGLLNHELDSADTYDDIIGVLLGVDADVLRMIEQPAHALPMNTADLRERVAHQILARRKTPQGASRLTPALVRDWADGTLQEWFQGYTDFDAHAGGQYRIRLQDDGTYEITSNDGGDPRRFHVLVVCVEAPA